MTAKTIHRGEVWHTPRRPSFSKNQEADLQAFASGALAVDGNGLIAAVGDFDELVARFPKASVVEYGDDALLLPGFVDTHIHFPQTDMIGSHGKQLLDWLDTYTYPTEIKVSRVGSADLQDLTSRFFTELLANGTTSSCVFATTAPAPTHALFQEAERRGVRAVIGKVSMDREAPATLLQSAAADQGANEQLIADWHGRHERLYVALTPRFAPACTPELLKSLGALRAKHPSVYVQTHHAETQAEVELVRRLFPDAPTYLDVYHRHGLLCDRTILAHSIHATDPEIARMRETSCRVAHCPTSNFFLGSGLMPMQKFVDADLHVALGTDVGAGTSFSLWQTMNEAYKAQHLRGVSVSPAWLFYMATLGGAEALSLASRTGSFAPGKAADFQVLRPGESRLLRSRWTSTLSASERLFALIFLADDRLVDRVYVQGREVFRKSLARPLLS